jgi:hypothetical protein
MTMDSWSLQHHSLLCRSPPNTSTSPQNPLTEQTLRHHSPARVVIANSPTYTTPPLQNPQPTQPLQHHSLLCQSPPYSITHFPQNPSTKQGL